LKKWRSKENQTVVFSILCLPAKRKE